MKNNYYKKIFDIPLVDYLKGSNFWRKWFYGVKVPCGFKHKVIKDYLKEALKISRTINKYIPSEFIFNSEKVSEKFLDKLLYLVCNSNNQHYYTVISEQEGFLKDLATISRCIGRRVDNVNSNCVNIYKEKQDIITYPIKIQKLEHDQYYGFVLDGNHRFLLGDCTVTHNTTVATIIGKIYQSLGVLKQGGPFIVAHRDDFIAEYLGQTAIKTKKLLESALGGVLFIDEVYAMGPRDSKKDSFSKEALDTLTSFLSENKDNLCVIAAGYDDEIEKCFFGMNPGLKRRFQWKHQIEKYTDEQIYQILIKMIDKIKWYKGFEKNEIIQLIKKYKEHFEYTGGDVENLVTKCKMTHSKRVFSLDNDHKFIITKKDIEDALLLIEKSKKDRKTQHDDTKHYSMYI